MNSSNNSSNRRYRKPMTRAERAIFNIEQAKRAPVRTIKPAIKSAPTPDKPMDAGKKARLDAAMAEIMAGKVAA